MKFPNARIEGLRPLDGSASALGQYARIAYRSVFPGIDMIVYVNGGNVEYDWVVAPRADPSLIRFSFDGDGQVRLDGRGDLIIRTPFAEIQHSKPEIYQDIGGARRRVAGAFVLETGRTVRFQIGDYDPTRTLVIDPQVIYRTNFGSSVNFAQETIRVTLASSVTGIAVDRSGNAYITGTAYDTSRGVTIPLVHAVQSTCPSVHCAFVTKLSADGKTILYSTFVGSPVDTLDLPLFHGPLGVPAGIACDPAGNVYVTGTTDPAKLPLVSGRVARSAGGNDAFIVKFDPNGVLKATMTIGGSGDDAGTSISFGPDGYLYVAGTTASTDFPISATPFVPAISQRPGLFILKIDPTVLDGDTPASTVLRYSAVFAASNPTGTAPTIAPSFVAVDSPGNAYIAISDCGDCQSLNLGTSTAALVRVNSSGTQASNVPFPAGSGRTLISGLGIDGQGNLYVTGTTTSPDFPTTAGAFITTSQPSQPGTGAKPFLFKLAPNGSGVVYSTYLTPDANESVLGMAIDTAGNAYISGSTASDQFPLLNSIQYGLTNRFCYHQNLAGTPVDQYYCTPSAAFLTVLKPDGTGLRWSTLLPGVPGAVGLDPSGNAYVAGTGVSVSGISPAGTPIPIDGIVNGASFHPGLPFPGGLASMFVHGLDLPASVVAPTLPLPSSLAGVSILIEGIPAPILSVSNVGIAGSPGSQQINFQVPFEAPGDGSVATVQLDYQGIVSSAVPTRVAPGIFTLADGSGAIQHAANFSVVTTTHPAEKGEVIIVYMTGLGTVAPAVATGAAATGPAAAKYCYSPPSASLGTVLYAGVTPGFPGLYQMNILIAPGTPSGNNRLTITWDNCWVHFEVPSVPPANDSTSNPVIVPVK